MTKIFVLYGILFSTVQIYGYNFTKESCTPDVVNLLQKQLTFNAQRDAIVQQDNLNYYLYKRESPNEPILLNGNNVNEVDLQSETKIIVFGWIEGHNRPWITNMKDDYLSRDDYNVIVFGYDYYADAPYIYANTIVSNLGELLGNFIVDVNLNLKTTHLIGHSLGAQISGFAGKQVQIRTGQKVARITGLDAAGPLFNFNPHHLRLDKEDADFVDALHTNAYIFGYKMNYASVDFYINGGIFQPGCKSVLEVLLGNITCEALNKLLFCSHVRSTEFWREGISSNKFIARNVNTGDEIVMGEDCPVDASGIYVLSTNAKSPTLIK